MTGDRYVRGYLRTALLALSLLLIPTLALAHSGHPAAQAEQVQVGPYVVTVENNIWPIKAHMNVDLTVLLEGGNAGKTAYARLIPPPTSTTRPSRKLLTSHATMAEALTYYNYQVPESGVWQLEFEVEGPAGRGVGRTQPFTVEGPPSFPLWLGYLITALPAVGFFWFLLRERRRVTQAIAADGGARV